MYTHNSVYTILVKLEKYNNLFLLSYRSSFFPYSWKDYTNLFQNFFYTFSEYAEWNLTHIWNIYSRMKLYICILRLCGMRLFDFIEYMELRKYFRFSLCIFAEYDKGTVYTHRIWTVKFCMFVVNMECNCAYLQDMQKYLKFGYRGEFDIKNWKYLKWLIRSSDGLEPIETENLMKVYS